MNPLPFSAAERSTGLATGPRLRYLATGNADLLPLPLGGGDELLPAEAPVIRIGPQPAAMPVASISTRQPTHQQTRESDVTVPLLQAGVTALMVGVAVGLLAWALAWPWQAPIATMGLTLAWAWFWRLRKSDGLLWTVETMTGRDVNHDGAIGRPQVGFTLTNPAAARSTVAHDNQQAAEDAERQQLQAFYDVCLLKGCSERTHGVKAGSGALRDAYIAHRDALLALGLAGWRGSGGNAGWTLTVRDRQRAHALIAKHTL